MKQGTWAAQSGADSPSLSVRAEAAVWVARLHGSGRSRGLEAGLKRWLKADPAHAEAFELATEAWEAGGSVASGVLPRMADPFAERELPRASIRPFLATAAAVLAAIGVGALLYLHWGKPLISTDIGEQRMLTLADGTRIFLNTDTRMHVEESQTRRQVRLESGEALFDVAQDPGRPFVVIAGGKEVVALGTAFVVRRDTGRLVVTLMEGKVAVLEPPFPAAGVSGPLGNSRKRSDADVYSASHTLAPGQRLTFTDRAPPKLDEPPLEEATAWRRGEVILDKTRLADAVEEMNRYNVVKLVIDDRQIADIRVSGVFRAGDSARFARAVAETYHLTVDHAERSIVIGLQ